MTTLTAKQFRALQQPGVWAHAPATKPKKAKRQPEYGLQKQFVQWMERAWPGVIVFSDTAAHIAKNIRQQVRANGLQTAGEKQPDTFIPQPSGEYAGLFIEFKAETPFKADGVTLKKNEHIEKQAATMERLRGKGYKCEFAWSIDQTKKIVNEYLNI